MSIDDIRHWIYAIMFLIISIILLALLCKIDELEKSNNELKHYKQQYEEICSRYGGNNCE